MTNPTYHTALSDNVTKAEPIVWWHQDGNLAFVHDFRDGLPLEFEQADFIYGEPPWKDGYDEFNRRSGAIDPLPFEQLMYRLNVALAHTKKPWILLVGAASSRCIGSEWMRRVSLNGSVAAIIGANGPPPPEEVFDAQEVIQWVTGNPDVHIVADLCAGYGTTCRIAKSNGVRFIAADNNPDCIGHIAENYPQWTSR